MHAETNSSGRVAVAEQLRDLAVRHHASARNAPDHFVNALAILWISLFQVVLNTARAGAPSPRLLLKRNGRQISSYRPAGTALRFKPSRMTTPCDKNPRAG